MTIVFAILFVVTLAFAIFLLIRNKKLEDDSARLTSWSQSAIADAQKAADQKVADMQREAQASVVPFPPFYGHSTRSVPFHF